MSWAKHYIEQLQSGEAVEFRPRGHSMEPLIKSGQLVRVEPATEANAGDIVLCRVRGREYLHLVVATSSRGYLIGNNRGKQNGWTRTIFGRVVEIT